MVKKILITMATIAAIFLIGMAWNKTNEYTLPGKIIIVYNEHWVMAETSDGNRWEFDGYGYKEGEKVNVTLNSQNTPDKRDDKIVMVEPR